MNIPDRLVFTSVAGTIAGLSGLALGWFAGMVGNVESVDRARLQEQTLRHQLQEQAVGLGYARWRTESEWSGDHGFSWVVPPPGQKP